MHANLTILFLLDNGYSKHSFPLWLPLKSKAVSLGEFQVTNKGNRRVGFSIAIFSVTCYLHTNSVLFTFGSALNVSFH